MALPRQPGTPTSYREALRGFSKNAKLYLAYATMSQINSGIFIVAFAFYLEELFFPRVVVLGVTLGVLPFVGIALGLNFVAHGFNSLPAGFIGDKYGRKRSFITASLVAIAAGAAVLVVNAPLTLMLLGVVVGLGEAFHGVVGAPFMMENSREAERIHLFTISGVLTTISTIVGAALAAILPSVIGAWLAGLPAGSLGFLEFGTTRAAALRLTLFMSVPFGLAELVPLFYMRESYALAPEPLREMFLLKHVRNKLNVGKLSILSLAFALGLGLYFPLLPLYFGGAYGVGTEEFGSIVIANNLAIAAAIFAVPLLVARWGKVRSIVYTRLLAVPFLAVLAFAPTLFLAGLFLVVRGAFSSLAFPVVGSFSMEVMERNERATTAGMTHAVFDLSYGGMVFLAGFLLDAGVFFLAFLVGAGLVLGHAVLWYRWFGDHPVDRASRPPPAAVGVAR
ncbi:MAG: MFS transporter [Thermoplasmata archaeon]